jgi:hypothetical protein
MFQPVRRLFFNVVKFYKMNMRWFFFAFFFYASANMANAQMSNTVERITVKSSLQLGTRTIGSFQNDTALWAGNRLPTSAAVKDFVAGRIATALDSSLWLTKFHADTAKDNRLNSLAWLYNFKKATDDTNGLRGWLPRWRFDNLVASGGTGWGKQGNPGTNAATDFFGTTDNQDVVAKANNNEMMRLSANGADISFGNNGAGAHTLSLGSGRFTFLSSVSGVQLNVGSGLSGSVVDVSKKFLLTNRGVPYLELFSNSNTAHVADFKSGVDVRILGGFRYANGTQAVGRVLGTDAAGNASWIVPDTVSLSNRINGRTTPVAVAQQIVDSSKVLAVENGVTRRNVGNTIFIGSNKVDSIRQRGNIARQFINGDSSVAITTINRLSIVKVTATSVVSSIAYVADPELSLTLTPGTWRVFWQLNGATAPGGIRYRFTGPTHIGPIGTFIGHSFASPNAVFDLISPTQTGGILGSPTWSLGGGGQMIWRTTASGALTFEWGQNASNATATTLAAGSFLIAEKIL